MIDKSKPKMLFLDDRTRRIHAALEKYSSVYDVTIVTNVKEALRYLSCENWDYVSMDIDLGGDDFVDLSSPMNATEIVRYLQMTGWPKDKQKPFFIIHSSNLFAANLTATLLEQIGFMVRKDRFVYTDQNEKKSNVGIVAGTFDILHPGYIRLFQFCKTVCDYLIVALHVENPDKPKPIFSAEERKRTLLALRDVDEVICYETEAEWVNLLKERRPDIRILGDDYWRKPITGGNLGIPICYHFRDTGWSATKVRQIITESAQKRTKKAFPKAPKNAPK
jgi:glycerol-3-phosphate cytidylyltransferase